MWKTLLLPIILVISLWLLTSGATTSYLLWLDNSYEGVLTQNVRSIQAADSLQNTVWRVLLDFPTDRGAVEGFRGRWPEASAELDRQLEILNDCAFSEKERSAIAELASLVAQIRSLALAISDSSDDAIGKSTVQRAGLRELGGKTATVVQNLRMLNQQALDRASEKRKDIQGLVLVGRTLLLIGGPALGVWLGWKLARRLHRSVAQLAVTLRDASTHLEQPVASIELIPGRDLGELQIQADQVASRVREVSQQLDAARKEVLQAERLAAVGELAAGLAHELRNPLTSIKLLLQHAARQSTLITLQDNKLRLILEEISKMEATIQGLLDFSRPAAVSRIRHDLTSTVARGLNLIHGRSRQQLIEVRSTISDEPLWIEGNSEQLHQVFVNLLINAIDAMPQGGLLDIVAGYSDAGTTIRLQVSDTGPGIAAEALSRLFEPFVTTKERGTGLGLAISRRIIDAHGGSIRAANRPEGGAIFSVEIPAALPN